MKKGFTLIELLVVISIISLGASIVFAATRTARDKAQDAKIKQSLVQIRSKAGLLFSGGCYNSGNDICPYSGATGNAGNSSSSGGGLCRPLAANATSSFFRTLFNNSDVLELMVQAKDASDRNVVWSYCAHSSYAAKWAIIVVLRTDRGKGWCVDSGGASKLVTVDANDSDSDGVYTNQNELIADMNNTVCGS